MIANKIEKHLVLFLDIRNFVYRYQTESDNLYMNILKAKASEIFQKESNSCEYFSLVLPSNEDSNSVSFMFNHIRINLIHETDIKNSVEYLKYRSRYETDIIGYSNFSFFVKNMLQKLLKQETLNKGFLKLIMVLSPENLLKLESTNDWNFNEFNRNFFSIKIDFINENIFSFDYPFGKMRYKPDLRLQLLSNNFSVNTDFFEQDYEANDSDFFYEKIEDPKDLQEFKNIFPFSMHAFVNLKFNRGWNLLNETESEFLFKSSKNESLICKIKQKEKYTTVTYKNVGENDRSLVEKCIREDNMIIDVTKKTLHSDENMMEIIDCSSFVLDSFKSRFFYFMIDDFVGNDARRDTFLEISKLLRNKDNFAVFKGRFYSSLSSFNTMTELTRLSRNFFILKMTLLSHDLEEVLSAFDECFRSFKKKFLTEIVHAKMINKSIMRIIVIDKKEPEKSHLSQQHEVYWFEDFNYFISSAGTDKFKIQKHSLLNLQINISPFYHNYFETVLNLELSKLQYNPLINSNDTDKVVYFLKTLKSSAKSQLTNERALSIFRILLTSTKISKVEWRVMVPNPFLPLDETYLATLKYEHAKIKKFINKFTIPLIIYFQILQNIEIDLRKDNDLRKKTSFFVIKYDYCLMHFSESFKKHDEFKEKDQILTEIKRYMNMEKISNQAFVLFLQDARLNEMKGSEVSQKINNYLTQMNLKKDKFVEEAIQMYGGDRISKIGQLKRLKEFLIETKTKYNINKTFDYDFSKDYFDFLIKKENEKEAEINYLMNPNLNKQLFSYYCKTMTHFCEHTIDFGDGKIVYFKLFRPEAYIAYQCVLNETTQEIKLLISFICLKCLYDKLRKKSKLVPECELTVGCKYDNSNYSKATSKCRDNVERILKLIFVIQMDQDTYSHHVFLSENKNNSFIYRNSFNYHLTGLISVLTNVPNQNEEKSKKLRSVFVEILSQIFELIFEASSHKTEKGVSIYYRFKNPEPNTKLEVLERIWDKGNSVPQIIQHLIRELLIFVNLNFEQIKMIRLQFLLFNKGNKKRHFFENVPLMFETLFRFTKDDKVEFMIREIIPNFEKIYNFFEDKRDEEYLKSFKSVIENRDNYFNTALVYVFTFMNEFISKFREKMENTVHNVLRVFFSSMYFESLFLSPMIFVKFPISTMERLEKCGKNQEFQMDFSEIQAELEKDQKGNLLPEYWVEKNIKKRRKNNESVKPKFYLMPKTQPMNYFLVYEIKFDKMIIKSYKSLICLSEQQESECEKCIFYEKIIEQNLNSSHILLKDIIINFYKQRQEIPSSNCWRTCQTLKNVFSLFYNKKFNESVLSMYNTEFIDTNAIYTLEKEESHPKEVFWIFPVYEERLEMKNFSEISRDIFNIFFKKFSQSFLSNRNIFLVNTAAPFSCLIEINNETNLTMSSDFVVSVRYYSEVKPDCREMYTKIMAVIKDTINGEIIKKIKLNISKTNEIHRNPIIMTFVQEILKESEIVINLPLLSDGVLIFYLNKIMQKNYKKVKDGFSEDRQLTVVKDAVNLKIGDFSKSVDRYFINFISEDYSYIKVGSDNNAFGNYEKGAMANQRREINDMNPVIFFFEHNIRKLSFIKTPETETVDNSFLFGSMKEIDEVNKIWVLNDFINPLTALVDLEFFKKQLRDFSFPEKEIKKAALLEKKVSRLSLHKSFSGVISTNSMLIDHENQLQKIASTPQDEKNNLRPKITITLKCNPEFSDLSKFKNDLIQMMKFAFYEYFLEMTFSAYLLKNSSIRINQSFSKFAEITSYLFKAQESQPITFKHCHYENKAYLMYLFHYFIELADSVILNLSKSCPHLKTIFHCSNLEQSGDNKQRNPKKAKKVIQKTEEAIVSEIIDISFSNRTEFKEWMSVIFEKKNNLFQKNELKFSLTLVPEEMVFNDLQDNSMPQKNTKDEWEDKYEKIVMFTSNYMKIDENQEKVIKFPPRRFFFTMNFQFKHIDYISYNLNEKTTRKIDKTIKKFNSSLTLKRDLFAFSSMQKLGFSFLSDSIKIVEKNRLNKSTYAELIEKIKRDFPNKKIKHYTDLVNFTLNSGLDDELMSKLMKQPSLLKQLYRDFCNLQYFFLNNVNSNDLKVVSLPEVNLIASKKRTKF